MFQITNLLISVNWLKQGVHLQIKQSSSGNYGSPPYCRKTFENLTGSCLLNMSIKFSDLQIYRKSLYHLQEVLKINTQWSILVESSCSLLPFKVKKRKAGVIKKKMSLRGLNFFCPTLSWLQLNFKIPPFACHNQIDFPSMYKTEVSALFNPSMWHTKVYCCYIRQSLFWWIALTPVMWQVWYRHTLCQLGKECMCRREYCHHSLQNNAEYYFIYGLRNWQR